MAPSRVRPSRTGFKFRCGQCATEWLNVGLARLEQNPTLECYQCGTLFAVPQSSPDLAGAREAADAFRRRTLENNDYEEIPLHIASIEPFPGGRIVRHGDRITVHSG